MLTDLRLQYLIAMLGNIIGGGKRGADGKPAAWSLFDFTLPWLPADSPLNQRPGKRRPPSHAERRRAPAAADVLSPEETRKLFAAALAPFGGVDPRYPQPQPAGG